VTFGMKIRYIRSVIMNHMVFLVNSYKHDVKL